MKSLSTLDCTSKETLKKSFYKLNLSKITSNLKGKRKVDDDDDTYSLDDTLAKIQFLNCATLEDPEDILSSEQMTDVVVEFDGKPRFTIQVTKFQSALLGQLNNHIKIMPKDTVDVDVVSKSIDYVRLFGCAKVARKELMKFKDAAKEESDADLEMGSFIDLKINEINESIRFFIIDFDVIRSTKKRAKRQSENIPANVEESENVDQKPEKKPKSKYPNPRVDELLSIEQFLLSGFMELKISNGPKKTSKLFDYLSPHLLDQQRKAAYQQCYAAIKSYFSNRNNRERLLYRDYTGTMVNPMGNFFASESITINPSVFIMEDKITLKIKDSSGDVRSVRLNGVDQTKPNLCDYSKMKRNKVGKQNGARVLEIVGFKVEANKFRPLGAKKSVKMMQHVIDHDLKKPIFYQLPKPSSVSPLINAYTIKLQAGFAKLSMTKGGIELKIPIAEHRSFMSETKSIPAGDDIQMIGDQDATSSNITSTNYVKSEEEEKKIKRRKAFQELQKNRIFTELKAKMWTFDPSRDPPKIKNNNSFGNWVYVVRNESEVNEHWKNTFSDTLCNDPGLKTFKVYFNVGNGDVFIMAPFLTSSIRYWEYQKSETQSTIDKDINEIPEIKELEEDMKLKWRNRTTMEHTTLEQKIQLLNLYEDASKRFESAKQTERESHEKYKEIAALQNKINNNKRKLHLVAAKFECYYALLLDPKFKADQNMLKNKPNGLAKTYKTTASTLSHASLKKVVLRNQARLGHAVVSPPETCSTMYSDCGLLESPGRKRFKKCPKCKHTTCRDECARGIVAIWFTRVLQIIRKISNTSIRRYKDKEIESNGEEPM